MAVKSCGLGRSARELRRHHYCGTCKVMGREYGHASRLFVNHDTVLLAEIVTALSGEPEWGAAIESRNCFRLPSDARSAPPALRYAAAATVLLTSAKLRDHAEDSGKLRWRFLARCLDPGYRRASAELRRWGVPVGAIERSLATQQRREASPESLDHLAEPTAFATAEICQHAAAVAGRNECKPALRSFGQRFGYLTYLLDAWEDFDRDLTRGDFNAFRALYGKRSLARDHMSAAREALEVSLQDLPLPGGFRDGLVARLRSNLSARFAESLPILATVGPPPPSPRRFSYCRDMCLGSCPDGCTDCGCDSCCDSCDCG